MAENFSQAMEKTAGADGTIKQIKVEDKIYDIKDQPLRDWVDGLNLAEQGAAGSYIQKVKQEDGKITATATTFATTIGTSGDNTNAPTTKAVRDAINALNATSVGSAGSYIQTVSETNGKLAATKTTFDTSIPTSNASTTNAPTTSAVRTAITDAINSLDVSAKTGTALQTITSINETDGKIGVTYSNIQLASTSQKGVVQLSSSTSSDNETMAATPKAVHSLLNSPTFTGTPTAPTAAQTANSTQIATTAFVKTAISNLINGAPTTLDTLKEIADWIKSDETATTALLTRIGNLETKVGISGSNASFNGTVTTNSLTLNGYAISIS